MKSMRLVLLGLGTLIFASACELMVLEQPPVVGRTVDRDRDGDGLSDREELYEWGTDPDRADSDFDGAFDGEEIFDLGTDPWVADSDGDGLYDGEEAYDYFTNPLDADTDGDGFSDGAEALRGWDPLY